MGAISELVGPECSGRTSLALAFVAQMPAVNERNQAMQALIGALASRDPQAAADMAAKLPPGQARNNAMQNVALVRRLAFNLLKSFPATRKTSVTIKRKKAGWDSGFLHEVLIGKSLSTSF